MLLWNVVVYHEQEFSGPRVLRWVTTAIPPRLFAGGGRVRRAFIRQLSANMLWADVFHGLGVKYFAGMTHAQGFSTIHDDGNNLVAE